MKKITIALLAISIVAILLLTFVYWSVESPAVSIEQLNRIKIGMTMAATKEILGPPRQKIENAKSVSWFYGHSLKWYSLQIDFNSDGRISSFTHDD